MKIKLVKGLEIQEITAKECNKLLKKASKELENKDEPCSIGYYLLNIDEKTDTIYIQKSEFNAWDY